ncbi:hypothetical protein ACO34A_09315 [Rhizobium sp. ACO-34A]|nr:hypothetical protein [Rhizobium sp. ACO-34A]ATN34007.1 hypothetical protein ACO34A_09315 [Rhizobium sp. ACO-34A]
MAKDDVSRLMEAFELLSSVRFVVGPEWSAAHEICQSHEGERLFDWGHAICHRIEGDDWNADYWYRQSGRKRLPSIADDWAALKAEL